MSKLADYQSTGDSASLKKIDGKPFTITKIEDSDYDDNGTTTKGVKVTTKESFDVDGTEWNKFHTTRVAIVKKLNQQQLRSDVNGGKSLGPVKCVEEKAQNGKMFWNLVDA